MSFPSGHRPDRRPSYDRRLDQSGGPVTYAIVPVEFVDLMASDISDMNLASTIQSPP